MDQFHPETIYLICFVYVPFRYRMWVIMPPYNILALTNVFPFAKSSIPRSEIHCAQIHPVGCLLSSSVHFAFDMSQEYQILQTRLPPYVSKKYQVSRSDSEYMTLLSLF